MNKSLISSIAAAALVGTIGLAYAQSQGTDTTTQPAMTQDQNTSATPMQNSTTMPASSMPAATSIDSSSPSSSVTTDSSTLAAQADRN